MNRKKEILLEIRALQKTFPGVVAVKDVSFDIRKGEVHVVIGENGAGKSTLVKMIAGVYGIDGGELIFEGQTYKPTGVRDAQQHGINMIHQELSALPNRTVAQNIFLGREPVSGFLGLVDGKRMNSDCKALLDQLGIDIDPTETMRNLALAQQQMVEIAKAIATENKLLIMDEPTSSLTQKEIDDLFSLTRRLKDGGMSIIYISHRMQELMEIGDRITVMRDGSYVSTHEIDNVNMQELIFLMVGRKIENLYFRNYNKPGEEMLRVEDLTGARFRNVNINVHAGEIVGIAGLVGAGRSELAKAIFGYDSIDSGAIWFMGKKLTGKKYGTFEAILNAISFLPEDRKTEGLCISMLIKDNIVQPSLWKLFKNGFIKEKKITEVARKSIKDLRIATDSENKAVFKLSGGNQQKVVLAKWLLTQSKLFIFDEPARGIDVGAKSEIYKLMDELAHNGASILMISSDLPELLAISDRIYVMKDGEITGEASHGSENFTQEHILNLAIRGRQTC